jgi:hypothetical protein
MSHEKSIAPVTEPCPVASIFVDELSNIVSIGAVTHLIFTTRQASVYEGSNMERVVQARLIVPSNQLQKIGRSILSGRVELPLGTDEMGNEVEFH